MAEFIISYDLIKKKDYPTLWAELARLKAKRVLLSMWYLDLNLEKAESVRNHFKKFVDSDDRIFVATVSDWASRNALATPNDA